MSVKNPCPICGKRTDSQGWCGSSDHDAGNPFNGINCLVVQFPQRTVEHADSRVTEAEGD